MHVYLRSPADAAAVCQTQADCRACKLADSPLLWEHPRCAWYGLQYLLCVRRLLSDTYLGLPGFSLCLVFLDVTLKLCIPSACIWALLAVVRYHDERMSSGSGSNRSAGSDFAGSGLVIYTLMKSQDETSCPSRYQTHRNQHKQFRLLYHFENIDTTVHHAFSSYLYPPHHLLWDLSLCQPSPYSSKYLPNQLSV